MKIKEKLFITKNGKSMALRSVTAEEAEQMIQHLRITHSESYRNLNQPPNYWKEFSIEAEAKILADFETSSSKFMLAAFYNNIIVGGLGFIGSQGDFLKHNGRIGMSIQQEFCSSGIGTEMMRYALLLAKEYGFHRVELTVRSYNKAGIYLYEKVGFQRVGLLKDTALIHGEYTDEYLYQIILPNSGVI